MKLGELCGWEKVNLRCQLPTEDLDALVSIVSDEDLANLLEEYDIVSRDRRFPVKIRAFLHPTVAKSRKSATPPSTHISRTASSGKASAFHAVVNQCVHKGSSPTLKKFVRLVRSGDDPHFCAYPVSRHHPIHQGTYCL